MLLPNLFKRLKNSNIELLRARYRLSNLASNPTTEWNDDQQWRQGIVSIVARNPPVEEDIEIAVRVGWWYPCLGFVALLATMLAIVLQLPYVLLVTAGGIWAFLLLPSLLFADPHKWYRNNNIRHHQPIEWDVLPVSMIPLVGLGATLVALWYTAGNILYVLWGFQIGCLVFYAWIVREHFKSERWTFLRHEISMLVLSPLIVLSSMITLSKFINQASIADLTLTMIVVGEFLLLIMPLAWIFAGHKLHQQLVHAGEHMAWEHKPETVPGQTRWVLFIFQFFLLFLSVVIISLFLNSLLASLGVVPKSFEVFTELTQSIINEVSTLPWAVSTSLVILLCMIFWSLCGNLLMWLHNLLGRRRSLPATTQRYSASWADDSSVAMYTANLNGGTAVTQSHWRSGESIIVFDTNVVDELCDEELKVIYHHEQYHVEQHHAWLLDILFKIGSLAGIHATAPFFYPARVEIDANRYAEKKTSRTARESAERKIARLKHHSLTGDETQPDGQRSSSETTIGTLRQWYRDTMTLQYSGLVRTQSPSQSISSS